MATLLMKAKFGKAFDPEVLFHSLVSDLINDLLAATRFADKRPGEAFEREDLLRIARLVSEESDNLGWRDLDADQREACLQSAAAPWLLSSDQIRTILKNVPGQRDLTQD